MEDISGIKIDKDYQLDKPQGAVPAERAPHARPPALLPPAHPQRRQVQLAHGARGVSRDDLRHLRRHVRRRLHLQLAAALAELRRHLVTSWDMGSKTCPCVHAVGGSLVARADVYVRSRLSVFAV